MAARLTWCPVRPKLLALLLGFIAVYAMVMLRSPAHGGDVPVRQPQLSLFLGDPPPQRKAKHTEQLTDDCFAAARFNHARTNTGGSRRPRSAAAAALVLYEFRSPPVHRTRPLAPPPATCVHRSPAPSCAAEAAFAALAELRADVQRELQHGEERRQWGTAPEHSVADSVAAIVARLARHRYLLQHPDTSLCQAALGEGACASGGMGAAGGRGRGKAADNGERHPAPRPAL